MGESGQAGLEGLDPGSGLLIPGLEYAKEAWIQWLECVDLDTSKVTLSLS